MGQGLFCAVDDMPAIGDVVPQRMLRPGGGGDTAFRDNLHALTQRRSLPERLTEGGFTLVATVNISMIDGGDP